MIVLLAHEGAPTGEPGSTLEEQLAQDTAFTRIVEGVSPEVSAIFTGHTHQTYAWEAPVPGVAGATARSSRPAPTPLTSAGSC